MAFKQGGKVEALGFSPLPLRKMGVYGDPRRASWPVRHEVRPVNLPE